MIFNRTPLPDAYVIEMEKREDDRGFFARTWCAEEFEAHGLTPRLVQANLSYNKRRGTLRGMHFQVAPHMETKLVRCSRGAIYDVIIDLRPESPTFTQHFGVCLREDNYLALYVPEGFAHGYLTLEDGAEVVYQVSEFYAPGAEGGVRFDDPAFGIQWPAPVEIISPKDAAWPDFTKPAAA